jgi:hypothetical protein
MERDSARLDRLEEATRRMAAELGRLLDEVGERHDPAVAANGERATVPPVERMPLTGAAMTSDHH